MRAGKVDLLADSRRQSGLRRARRTRIRRRAEDSNAVNRRSISARIGTRPRELCHWHVQRSALSRILERCPRLRRHRQHCSAADLSLFMAARARTRSSRFWRACPGHGHDSFSDYWQKQHAGADFDAFWRKSLHDGWVEGTAFAPKSVSLQKPAARHPTRPAAAADPNALEVNFRRDPSIYDGRFANNGWLQELPKPLTKLTWDNPIHDRPDDGRARRLNFKDVVDTRIQRTRKSKARSGFRPDILIIRSRSSSATAARAPAAPAPAPASTFTRCAPARLPGSRPARNSPRPAISINSPARRATRPWRRRDGASRPLVRRSAVSRSTSKEPNFAKEGEPPAELTLYPAFRLFKK